MRVIYMIIGMMATLGLNVSAVALRIYTPVHRNFTIVTLTPEWTIDRRTKNDFLRNPDTAFGHIQQPRGGNNFFAVTGLMEWGTQNFSEKRAFWVTSADFEGEPFKADPYSPAQGMIRNWLKVRQVQYRHMITSQPADLVQCTVRSTKCLKVDVWVYLVPKGYARGSFLGGYSEE
jgi:hypothetical protein